MSLDEADEMDFTSFDADKPDFTSFGADELGFKSFDADDADVEGRKDGVPLLGFWPLVGVASCFALRKRKREIAEGESAFQETDDSATEVC